MTDASIAYPRPVGSAAELFALAMGMEEEAARRYAALAARMEAAGEARLAVVFGSLARMELGHATQVVERARAAIGAVPIASAVAWELPVGFDDEAARSATLTPYRALAIAVRNEERSFAFFSYLAATAPDDAVRSLAEDFAREELDHAALLRRERRLAWRETPRDRAPPPDSVTALLKEAETSERGAAASHRALAARLQARGEAVAAEAFAAAAAAETALANDLAARLPSAASGRTPQLPPAMSARDGLRLLEAAFDRYSDIVDHARDEAVMREAQALAERALTRLAHAHGTVPAAAGPESPVPRPG